MLSALILLLAAAVERRFCATEVPDSVDLYVLNGERSPMKPAIENWRDMRNHTRNRRRANRAYLNEPVVPRWLWDAMTAA